MVNVKILGISTSPRHANTEVAVKWSLDAARELPWVETDFISLVGKTIYPCDGCYRCVGAPKDNPCPGIQHDDFREICLKMVEPDVDGYIMGAMVDYQTAGALFHCLKSRLMCLQMNQSGGLRSRVFGAIAIGGDPYGGQTTTLQYMNMWAMQVGMYVVGAGPEHSNICGGFGGASGSTCFLEVAGKIFRGRGPVPANSLEEKELIKEDTCCKLQCEHLGKRVAETAKIINAGYEAVSRDEIKWAKGPITGGEYKIE